MKRETQNAGKILDRFFRSASRPSFEQLEQSRRNVLQRLRTEALRPAHSEPGLSVAQPHPRFRLAAVAAMAAIAIIASAVFLLHELSPARIATAADGARYRFGDVVRSAGSDGLFVRLADGSRIEMRSDTELSLEKARDGVRIRLKTGEVIVSAAKQHTGHLYVQTKDVIVSVIGTVFLVDTDEQGSRVAVIQGEVQIRQDGIEKKLHPGDQVATNPLMDFVPMPEELSWSRDAESHMALLAQSLAPPQAPAIAPPQPPVIYAPPVLHLKALGAWEVVAIRPCNEASVSGPPGGRGAGPRPSPGRITFECMTVQQMISLAYERLGEPLLNASGGLPGAGKLRSGPSWVRSDKYRIDAKAEGTPDAKVMEGPMLRALLEDRFQLKLHRETEEAPMYALTVAKSGVRIQPIGLDGCRKRTPEDNFTYEQMLAWIRRGEKPYCGINGGSEGLNIIWDFGGSTLSAFAGVLSGNLDRHVLDKTGIEGRFNIHLEYVRDENTSPRFGDPVERPDIQPGPSIFTAVEQLGLKLEPTKGPREYMVIDGIERPSEN